MEKIKVSELQALSILEVGKDRATGIIIELNTLRSILGVSTSVGGKALLAMLPHGMGLRYEPAETAGDKDTIILAKKPLENALGNDGMGLSLSER